MTFKDRIVGLIWAEPARLKEHPENWRRHPNAQRSAFKAVLEEVGIAGAALAFVADTKSREAMLALSTREERATWLASFRGKLTLIDGHLRRRMIGQPIPTLVLDVGPEEARKALASHDAITALATAARGALIQLAERAAFSNPTIQAALAASQARYAVPLPSMAPPPLAPAEDEEEPVVPTDALVKKWGTASGQLWVVPSLTVPGRAHRLLCGDCRDPANVERLHEGATPDLGLHDPPYGIGLVKDGKTYGRAKTQARRTDFAPIEGDEVPFDPAHLLSSCKGLALWGGNHFADKLPPSPGIVVWDKRCDMGENTFSEGEIAWLSPHMGKRLRFIRHLWNGMYRASERGEQRLHPTQKPIVVQQQIVEWYSKPGDLVADWYMGAGAVIIACERTGRIGHGMDIAPAYLAATLERLAARGLKPRML